MIRCVMADDHVLVREILWKIMEQTSTIRIIGDHDNAREAAEHAVDQRSMSASSMRIIPSADPFEGARWGLKASHFPLKKLFLTGSTEEEHILNAVEAGASAYLKSRLAGFDELQKVIAKIYLGAIPTFPFSPDLPDMNTCRLPSAVSSGESGSKDAR